MFKFEWFFALAIFSLAAALPAAADEKAPEMPCRCPPGGVSYLSNPQASDTFKPVFDSTYFPIVTNWGPEQTLSDSTMDLFHPHIARGDSVLTILTYMMPAYEYFFRSPDEGTTWLQTVFTDSMSVIPPELASVFADGAWVYTTWLVRRAGGDDRVFFRASMDYGTSWPVTQEIVQRPLHWMPPRYGNVSGHLDTAFVSFDEDSLACWRSFDGGVHWANPGYIGGTYGIGYPPSISYAAGVLHIAYNERVAGENDVHYVRSTDHGISFEEPRFLGIPDGLHGQWPELAADSFGNVAVAWMDYHGSSHSWTGAALCRVSHDSGQTWGETIRLDASDYLVTTGMHLVVDGNFIAVAWVEPDGWIGQLHYRESWDGGTGWLPEQVLDQGWVATPWLLKHGGVMHITWIETIRISEPGNDRQFLKYMRNDELSGTREDAMPAPMESELFSFPNPFNTSVTLSIKNAKGGDAIIDIYDIRGGLIKTIRIENGKAKWDATDALGKKVSSGVYFAGLAASPKSHFIKLLFLK